MNITNKHIDLKIVLIIGLVALLCICVYKLIYDQRQLKYLSIISSQQTEQTSILRDQNYQLLHPAPTTAPTETYNDNRKLVLPNLYPLTLNCPDYGKCEFAIENGYNEVRIGDSIWLSFYRIDNKTLNNPNYASVLSWYDALMHKNPKAVGSNLDELYGAVNVDGTDGYIFPFYREYDLNLVESHIFGKNPGLIAKSSQTYSTNFLIPHGQYVYKFGIGTIEDKSVQEVIKVLDTIEFTK